jgi:hypothetical protein
MPDTDLSEEELAGLVRAYSAHRQRQAHAPDLEDRVVERLFAPRRRRPIARLVGACLVIAAVVAATAVALVIHERGTVAAESTDWHVVSISGDGDLAGVDCVAAADCWAVGAGVSGAAVIEHYDGSQWTRVVGPDTGPGTTAALTAVTCVGADDCWAVGSAGPTGESQSTLQPLTEHYTGSEWTIAATTGLGDGWLVGVTCPASNDCWAVGASSLDSIGDTMPLFVHYDGQGWAQVSNGSPVDQGTLASVTCVTATECWAVGNTNPGPGPAQDIGPGGLIERYAGGSWTTVPGSTVGELSAVTCSSGTDCWAVGYSASGPVVEHYAGSSWTDASGIADQVVGDAVACSGPGACWVVGYTVGGQPALEQLEGGSWVVPNSPSVPGGSGILYAVTCASATGCWAIGADLSDPTLQPLIETNGP